MNKPHLTPNPDKPHTPGTPERAGDPPGGRRPVPKPLIHPAHGADPGGEPADDEPSYDSCFDDLNAILSQSIQQPDPDPNLDSTSGGPARAREDTAPHLAQDRGKPPRTSEIFRTVVLPGAAKAPSTQSVSRPEGAPSSHHEDGPAPEPPIPDVVLDRDRSIQGLASEEEDQLAEPRVSWGHLLLLSYSSAITLAMIWVIWTGRWSGAVAPRPAASEQMTPESSPKPPEPDPDTPAPRIPAENQTTMGKAIRIGDLEVTPLYVAAAPVELRRSILPGKRRREGASLILRMRLTNISKLYTFTPLDQDMVRERGVRPHDPYVETSDGRIIRLFPLALDSEWSIVGQEFSELRPGETEETFVAAEPGAAHNLADEMTWRVRLRVGPYRTDMLGVRFTRSEVR